METCSNSEKLERAKRKVRRIKGFYIHALVYLLVNLLIIFSNGFAEKNGFADMDSYYTAILWGFGLLAHGLTVFGPQMILGDDWEERKIREMMNK